MAGPIDVLICNAGFSVPGACPLLLGGQGAVVLVLGHWLPVAACMLLPLLLALVLVYGPPSPA